MLNRELIVITWQGIQTHTKPHAKGNGDYFDLDNWCVNHDVAKGQKRAHEDWCPGCPHYGGTHGDKNQGKVTGVKEKRRQSAAAVQP